MKMRFFDFEVFPHWWLCVFGDLPDGEVTAEIKSTFTVVHSDQPYARDTLIRLLKEQNVCVCGYNIKHYDLIIANAIYQGFTPEEVKIVNDIIINPSLAYSTKDHARLSSFAKRKFSTIYEDLMDDNSGSLKELEANLGLCILESSVSFDKENLTEDDKLEVIKYCKQDVYATMKYFEKIVVYYCKNKELICKTFNINANNAYTSTNATLVGMALGARKSQFSDEYRMDITLPYKIKEYCYDNLPHDILNKILENGDSFDVTLFGNTVTFGNGGIHSTINGYNSETDALYIETDDNYCLLNIDAASYYPSIMIQFKLLSRAIRDPERFKNIFDTRIAIKSKTNPTKEDNEFNMASKLVLNTTFGASGNKWLALYDPYMCTSVCRVGQIFLAAFANRIYNYVPDIKVVQTNTDGVLVYIKRSSINKLKEYVDEWQNISGINMEIEFVNRIWQKNVNNYILTEVNKSGKEEIKSRGQWLKNENHRVGGVKVTPLTAFVCANAVRDFLIYGNDIIETIVNCNNLQDFAISCTKGPTYSAVVHKINDIEVPLTRANRIYATKSEKYGKLYKIKKYKGNLSYTQMPSTPEHCKTINDDLSNYNFNDIKTDLDYMYYIGRAYDLLDVSWKQLLGNEIIKINKFDI
jgi:hypothetical protein